METVQHDLLVTQSFSYFIFIIKWEIALQYYHTAQPAKWPFKSRWAYFPDVDQTNPAGQEIDKGITLETSAGVSDQKAIYCEDKDAYLIIIRPYSVHRGLNPPWYGANMGSYSGHSSVCHLPRYSNKLSVSNLKLHRISTFTDQHW